jgi:hypothetical protein
MTERVSQDTGRVVAVAVALWAAVAAIAAAEGVAARYEPSELAVFAALVSLYAVGLYALDRSLRDYVMRQRAGPARAIALGVAAAFAATLALQWTVPAIFLSPLAALALAALRDHLPARRGATPASSAKSPGATPAAT